MKKEYISPVVEVVKFQEEDIITTSTLGNINKGGDSKIGWGDF